MYSSRQVYFSLLEFTSFQVCSVLHLELLFCHIFTEADRYNRLAKELFKLDHHIYHRRFVLTLFNLLLPLLNVSEEKVFHDFHLLFQPILVESV